MKKKEELFYLIKSLTKSEKRYFKIETQKSDSAEYLTLFNAIDAQKSYNETAIKELFKEKAFITQLTTIKNYLKLRVLQSLRNYHSKISAQAELRDILRNIEILFHKGLYTICESELKRAEKKAVNFQQNLLLFQIQDWKRKVHQAQFPLDFKTIRSIISTQKEVLNTSIEYTNLLLANTDPTHFSLTHKKTNYLQNKTLKTLHTYKKHLSSKNESKAKQTIEGLIKEWEQNPELLKEYFTTYFSAYNNYLSYLTYKKMHKEALVRILLLKQKIKDFSSSPTSAALIKETLHLYNIELEIHRGLKDLHNTHEIITDIMDFITTNKMLIPSNYWLSFRFQFAAIYFHKKDHKKALYWANNILNNQNKKNRKDLITYTYWINLLIHYELRNGFALKHLIESIKKYIKKQKNIEFYEKLILKFMSKTVESEIQDRKLHFNNLKNELKKHPIPKQVLDYIDFNEWIQSNL